MKSKTLILAGGEIFDIYNDYSDCYVIAVDKGFEFALENEINVDIVIGDFDSLSNEYKSLLKNVNVLEFDKDKDMSDLELAYKYCLENKLNEIIVLGAIGTRLDHTMINIQLLKTYKDKMLDIKYLDKNNEIFYVNNDIIIKKRMENISILAGNEETVISLYGVKWPLKQFKISYGSSLTVSNKFVTDAQLQIHKGGVFVILSKD